MTSWRLDLEIHICIPKVNPGLVVTGWDTVFIGNGVEMLKLVVEHVRDIHVDPVVVIPEEPGEAKDSLGSGAGVKLGVQSVPVFLGRWKNSHNITSLCDLVFHLKSQVLDHKHLHGKVSVTGVVSAAHILNILFSEGLEANSSFSFLNYFPDIMIISHLILSGGRKK